MSIIPTTSLPRTLILAILFMCTYVTGACQITPLANAFAHNDYWHKRPLFDAMEHGFTHVEADIYLRRGRLVVAHMPPFLSRHQTLEKMYLARLWNCIKENSLVCPSQPVTLAIDIKSNATRTYRVLTRLLEKYKPMLTSYENGTITYRQVTIVLTGKKPNVKDEEGRFVFIDEDLREIQEGKAAQYLSLLASCKYSRILTWNGTGEMPEEERSRLCQYVQLAHKYGQKVRLWASPEKETVWNELLNCGVDLINSDKLGNLRSFLLNYSNRLVRTDIQEDNILAGAY